MNIIVNGEPRDVSDGTTVAGLLDELGIERTRVAVEVGLDIVPKNRYAEHALQAGDRVEIVHFVGGG